LTEEARLKKEKRAEAGKAVLMLPTLKPFL